jgi:hypothetical protein
MMDFLLKIFKNVMTAVITIIVLILLLIAYVCFGGGFVLLVIAAIVAYYFIKHKNKKNKEVNTVHESPASIVQPVKHEVARDVNPAPIVQSVKPEVAQNEISAPIAQPVKDDVIQAVENVCGSMITDEAREYLAWYYNSYLYSRRGDKDKARKRLRICMIQVYGAEIRYLISRNPTNLMERLSDVFLELKSRISGKKVKSGNECDSMFMDDYSLNVNAINSLATMMLDWALFCNNHDLAVWACNQMEETPYLKRTENFITKKIHYPVYYSSDFKKKAMKKALKKTGVLKVSKAYDSVITDENRVDLIGFYSLYSTLFNSSEKEERKDANEVGKWYISCAKQVYSAEIKNLLLQNRSDLTEILSELFKELPKQMLGKKAKTDVSCELYGNDYVVENYFNYLDNSLFIGLINDLAMIILDWAISYNNHDLAIWAYDHMEKTPCLENRYLKYSSQFKKDASKKMPKEWRKLSWLLN